MPISTDDAQARLCKSNAKACNVSAVIRRRSWMRKVWLLDSSLHVAETPSSLQWSWARKTFPSLFPRSACSWSSLAALPLFDHN